MKWLSEILAGGVGQLFKDIVGSFKLSPEKEAELLTLAENNKQALLMKQAELEQKAEEVRAREIEAASANIRAEAETGDKYTSRARPSFIYLMLVILGANYIVFPLIGKPIIAYPEALFWLFGSVMLGYTGARTWEKFMSLPGESKVELPFGIKAKNDGGK